MTIEELVKDAYANSKAHGFHDGTLNIAEKLCLIHSEVSEALECNRNGEPDYWMSGPKPEGLATELADVVIRVADLCGALGIDLQFMLHQKMKYNSTRPHKHGKAF